MKSRSNSPDNTVVFRHETMFSAPEVADQYEDFTGDLKQYQDTPRDSFWRFRKSRTRADNEAETNLVLASDGAVSIGRAQLTQMTAEQQGSYFTLKPDATYDDVLGNGDKTPHEHAGTIPPIAPVYVGLYDDELFTAAIVFLREEYAGRTPDQQAEFRAESVPAQPAARPARRRRTQGAQ